MNSALSDLYTSRSNKFKEEQKKYTSQIAFTSILRLIIFAVFGWFVYMAFKARFTGYYLLWALITIGVFISVVVLANILKKKINLLQQLILINENEINMINGIPSCMDNGNEYLSGKGFAADLSIFGNHSLYHILNRTGSRSGKEALSDRLRNPLLTKEGILQSQHSVQELAQNIQFRQTLLANTLLFKEEEALSALQSKLSDEEFAVLRNRVWSVLAIFWPVAGILVLGFCIWKDRYPLLLLFGVLGLLVLSFVFKKISQLYNHISKRSYLFEQYAYCFQLICNENFADTFLKQKQNELKDASLAFKKLSKLVGLFDLRLSMFSFFINGLLLSDLLCARSYLAWNEQWQSKISGWFTAMGEIEMLNSLASFHFNHPDFVFPDCKEEGVFIEATAMGHPLMKEGVAVANDINIGKEESLHLITGSNMSGKSTFLRTLGLNLILAQAGAPVFASSFVFRPMRLLTSFHHIDSLEESTSYFYAELKSLQQIIQSLALPEPALVLLDEVMRGTNSKDKHDGTALLIKKLLQYPCIAMIATHDTELGILSETYKGSVENFCFESELSDKGLTFDFTMRKGVAQTKNATYLMQQMGII